MTRFVRFESDGDEVWVNGATVNTVRRSFDSSKTWIYMGGENALCVSGTLDEVLTKLNTEVPQ